MMKWLGCLGVLVVVALIVGGMVMGTYNNLVGLGQAVDAQWAQVENQYQRRADLIPNLVSTVQGAANFEKSTLEEVVKARASVGQVNLGNLPNDPAAFARFQQAQDAPLERPLAPHGGGRAVPRAQGQPELPRPAGRPRGHGEPHLGGAQPLQRGGAGLQHGPPALPGGPLREPPRHEGEGLLQGGRRAPTRPRASTSTSARRPRRPSSGRPWPREPWCAPPSARSSPSACWPERWRGYGQRRRCRPRPRRTSTTTRGSSPPPTRSGSTRSSGSSPTRPPPRSW